MMVGNNVLVLPQIGTMMPLLRHSACQSHTLQFHNEALPALRFRCGPPSEAPASTNRAGRHSPAHTGEDVAKIPGPDWLQSAEVYEFAQRGRCRGRGDVRREGVQHVPNFVLQRLHSPHLPLHLVDLFFEGSDFCVLRCKLLARGVRLEHRRGSARSCRRGACARSCFGRKWRFRRKWRQSDFGYATPSLLRGRGRASCRSDGEVRH
mmetsp:Transcript_95426/g.179498  ORF Transcript_95426/g.179498 Transcript_95426/m.179498 type:complete len:207 (+) Transcript_95426:398-1018(+)